jgi:hypothetical protein
LTVDGWLRGGSENSEECVELMVERGCETIVLSSCFPFFPIFVVFYFGSDRGWCCCVLCESENLGGSLSSVTWVVWKKKNRCEASVAVYKDKGEFRLQEEPEHLNGTREAYGWFWKDLSRGGGPATGSEALG